MTWKSWGIAAFIVTISQGIVVAAPDATKPVPKGMVDLTRAVLVIQEGGEGGFGAKEEHAAFILRQYVEERTGIHLEISLNDRWPTEAGFEYDAQKQPIRRPVIALGFRSKIKAWAGPMASRFEGDVKADAPEGYRIAVAQRPGAASFGVAVAGNDSRGVLYGVGRLLRELRLEPARILLPEAFEETSAPRVALRGHQLGYRPKTNSYDAWDQNQWHRYMTELALFGTNAVEFLPPRTDDDADSPHFPLPPLPMLRLMSLSASQLNMDVWLWFPAMDADYTDPAKVKTALDEWFEVFRGMPRLDAVFVPGGDPGHTRPKILLDFLAKVTTVLHEVHPSAQMWVSPQGFNSEWMDEFVGLLKAEPKWLTGVVFGPQVRTNLIDLRKAVPSRYPIRGYPDITHSRQCQHPVPNWDLAFAATEGREVINPRPRDEATIFKGYVKDTIGFITYSEGCNDDVNKFVWSALGWNPDADLAEVLRQYSRFFVGDLYADSFAQGLTALERNWDGPLLTNANIETTLHQFQDLDRLATPKLRLNWRYQQALYRAYYDAYLRERLTYENGLESQALEVLRRAPIVGSAEALRGASWLLDRALTDPVSLDRRARVFEIGEALYQSIRMQLSVARHQAIAAERGANLDTIDVPLNNRVWLEQQFSTIRSLSTEPERLGAIDALLNRTDPGPGGFYDELGDPARRPHLVTGPAYTDDPMQTQSAFTGFALRTDWPTAWRRYGMTFYDAPIKLRYDGLDPGAHYRVRVTYAGDNSSARMRLEADEHEVHALLKKPNPVQPIEFEVPAAATSDGRLLLTFSREPGFGGNGRGCQVAEVWLTRSER